MGCTTCSGNPNTWCTQCMPAEDTWVAPVDKLPDVFMGDRDHMYLLPNGDLYILSPDRTKWIKVNGQGGGVTYDDTAVINRLKALEGKTDNFISSVNVSRNGNKVKLTYTLVDGTVKEVEFEDKDTVALAYDDSSLRNRIKALEDKPDNDRQTLTFTEGNRNLSISNGNSVTLPNDKQTISKQGNKLVLSNGGGEVDLPTPNNATPYDDSFLRGKITALENKPDNDRQTLSLAGTTLSISNGNSVNLPQYVSPQEFNTLKNEYNQLKGAFEKLLQDLKGSGAWKQTGGTIFEGNLYPDRHIATGNINLFGGTVDGNAFIRTNNGKTENDLAGGIN